MYYCASVFQIAERDGKSDPSSLWEEQFLLIEASTEADAHSKAEQMVKNRAPSYLNKKGESVSWKFVKIERIYPIEDTALKTGTELFSRFLRDSEARSLLTPFEQ